MPQRVEGIISPMGAFAGGDGKTWSLIFHLNPWRGVGAAMIRKDLRVLIAMQDKEAASSASSEWHRGDAVALTVQSIGKMEFGTWLAFADLPIARNTPDVEMETIAAARTKPRSVDDAVLGRLTLDRRFAWYEGKRKTRHAEYAVSIETPEPDNDKKIAKAILRAGPIALAIDRDLSALRDAIVDRYLDLYNTKWREGGRPLSRAAFKKRLSINSLVISQNRTTAYFDADGLFTDHIIEVRLSPRGRVSEICLAG